MFQRMNRKGRDNVPREIKRDSIYNVAEMSLSQKDWMNLEDELPIFSNLETF
jgi:hypothetical protein